jgi:hypothetical protein
MVGFVQKRREVVAYLHDAFAAAVDAYDGAGAAIAFGFMNTRVVMLADEFAYAVTIKIDGEILPPRQRV